MQYFGIAMPSEKPSALSIGLMSGTSADGVDGVLLEIHDQARPELHATCSQHYSDSTKKKIRKTAKRKIRDASEAAELDMQLAGICAGVVNRLIEHSGPARIAVVGCHGQTVHHSPNSKPPFSLQIGNAEELARLTNLPVVSNFRSADIQAGGQGAPLAPAFHQAVFASPRENRSVINIGGISNITCLPADPVLDVTGFDTGPGNTLIDNWCRTHFGCAFDKDGEIAKTGEVQLDLLNILLDDKYLKLETPKSTGLEYFNMKWVKEKLGLWDGYGQCSDADILATLTEFTATSIADALNALTPGVSRGFLCGGGAHNPLLVSMLARRTDFGLEPTTTLGIDPQWVEAAAFAWMAYRTVQGLTSTLPSVTGASRPVIAGTLHAPPAASRVCSTAQS